MSEAMTKRAVWLFEEATARALGIPREEFRRVRHKLLTPGVDYVQEKTRVNLTASGEAKLAGLFKLPTAHGQGVQTGGRPATTPEGTPQKNAAPGARACAGLLTWPALWNPVAGQPVKLHVWRTFPKNAHIIEGYLPGTDPEVMANRVRIKVRDSSRFSRFDNTGKPLALECRRIAEGFYELIGPGPKRRGRV